ncbi:MAG: hypothetical protein HYR51_11505 [Candidatus Rokubacteria bacterium]|nr:hypothetical protein [Candidatus Rokubacteria bacterium]
MRAVSLKDLKNRLGEYVRLAVRRGWLTRAVLSRDSAMPPRRPVAPLSEILAELDADRGDRNS